MDTNTKFTPVATLVSQFLALLMTTHPRCGCLRRNSGISSSTIPTSADLWLAVRTVWEWIVGCCGAGGGGGGGGCVKFISASVWSGPSSNVPSALFTFAVSMHTLGVVTKHTGWWQSKAHVEGGPLDKWVGANQIFAIRRTWPVSGDRVEFCSYRRAENGSVNGDGNLIARWSSFCSECVNHKWLVAVDFCQEEACVANLLAEPPTAKFIQLPSQWLIGGNCSMNQCNEDEVVFLDETTTLRVSIFNLPHVWSTGSFSPIFYAEYLLPDDDLLLWCPLAMVLVLKTESSGRAFIALLLPSSGPVIFQFTEASGPNRVHMSEYNTEGRQFQTLSQMSERLYCVTLSPNTLEVWDCNNPTKAMSVVDCSHCCWLVARLEFSITQSAVTVIPNR
ncbi:hypothetical protein Pelo_17234 [Pelomyxa schiedti]|nr:hypothetical protein Pelo_17234 [Pelomyxa schiedti]